MKWFAETWVHFRNLLTQPSDELTRAQRSLAYSVELGHYSTHMLSEHRATQMAAALTYRTIFSLVPLFVLALIAFRAFGGFEEMGKDVQEHMYGYMGISALSYSDPNAQAEGEEAGMRERLDIILTELTDKMSEVSFGSIGAVGIVLLIWAALALVVEVEHSFNTIYNAPAGRAWHMRITIYWAVITLGPILLMVSLSAAGQVVKWVDVPGAQQRAHAALIGEMEGMGKSIRADDRGQGDPRNGRGPAPEAASTAPSGPQSAPADHLRQSGGALRETHAAFMAELQRGDDPVNYVRSNLATVDVAAERMFTTWKERIAQFKNPRSQNRMSARLALTRKSYDEMVTQMTRQKKLPGLAHVVAFLSRFAAFAASWLLLFLLYRLMPNARVAARPAAIGAFIAAILWEVGKWGFSLYVTYAVPYSKVYGALGLIPLFLFWLYITWLVVLFGMELTYALQTLPDFRKQQKQQREQARVLVGNPLWLVPIMTLIGERFEAGEPAGAEQLADELGLPQRAVADLCRELEQHHMVHRVENDGDSSTAAYSLARSPRQITMGELVQLAATLTREGDHHDSKAAQRSWSWLNNVLKQDIEHARATTLADVIEGKHK